MANKKNGITAGQAPSKAPNITTPPPRRASVVFSFKYLSRTKKFSCEGVAASYAHKLTERLAALSQTTVDDLLGSRSSALRCHPIRWDGTSEPDGFTGLAEQLRELTPYQFSISSNEHGRVHGFFIDDVFHVVWLDPHHRLYPGAG